MRKELIEKLLLLLVAEDNNTSTAEANGDIRIVILQRGWVAVGRFFQKGKDCWLEDASIVRKWGTKEGLGELAEKGPLSETKLDKCNTIKFHELTVVATIDCEASAWKNRLT